jgi:hypothetical protein
MLFSIIVIILPKYRGLLLDRTGRNILTMRIPPTLRLGPRNVQDTEEADLCFNDKQINRFSISIIFFRRLSCVNATDIAEEATQAQTDRCNLKASTMCIDYIYLFLPWTFIPLPWGAARGFRKSLYIARFFPCPSSMDQGRNLLRCALLCKY